MILHLFFNTFGTCFFAFVLAFFSKAQLAGLLSKLFGYNIRFQLAYFNLFQNLIWALWVLTFLKPVVKFANMLVDDKRLKRKE